jgi:hypothetical protein
MVKKYKKIMIRYARTFGNQNYPQNMIEAWKYPTAPIGDTFGIPVEILNKTFGLEEFNFSKKLRELKLAYIPCYGNARFYPRPFIQELHLIFKTEGRNHIHYATLHNVTSILNSEINQLKSILKPNLDELYFNIGTRNFFEEDFSRFQDQINFMFERDVVAANQLNASFLVNVRYEKLSILNNSVTLNVFPGYVGQWKVNVIHN